LELFANNTGAIVLAEHTSNLTNISFISCVDRVLNMMEDYSVYQPEVVIHIGGAIVSKRIKTFLRRNNALEVLRIDETELIEDTFKHLTTHLSISPESFFEQFKDFTSESRSNFFGKWKQKDLTAQDNCHSVSAELKGLNDWYCFYLIHQYFQENTVIHMGNSSVVRYMQLFDVVKGCNYYGNRGTSGIDGSFSTAVGAAVASPEKNHLFVCGDVSFLYDHNALWIEKFPNNLKVIIIHNSGGGIFKIIEGAKDSTKSSTYFEAKHSQEVTPIIKAFHKRAQQVCSAEYLDLHLQAFLTFGNDDIQFLEIKTEAESNPHVLTNFFNKIK
jgi:2-succinyl-5-enolpyruvyl-6-hydroxy-3-cyclohexene-1-carboxylate synthase